MKFISDNGPLEACQHIGIAGACIDVGFAPTPKDDPLMAERSAAIPSAETAFTGAGCPMTIAGSVA